MKKNLIKFLITVSILLTTFNTNILAQNRISGEKLEKLLTENHIIIYDFFGPLRNNIELNFNANKTYKLNGVFPISAISIHPSSGNWEIVGFGNSSVRLTDIQNQNQYSDKKASFQLLFGDDGNIYNLNQKLYSYRLENKKERIENNARRIEEERIAEELRLKKIEEEKRQLAIKREQERIKAEQIKKEEERKRLELAEWAKKEEEERIKRENEERIKLEREELFKNILKYSLILIGIIVLTGVIYYLNKFHKDKVKNLFLNLKNYFKNKFFNKELLNKNIKNFSNFKATFNKPPNLLNVKDFNISKSTLFKMTDHNTFEIKFKKKVLKEEFFDFLKKNLQENRWKFFGGDRSKQMWSLKSNWNTNNNFQIYAIKCLGFPFRYQYLQNFMYAEEFTNLVNKKFSSLDHLTNEEVFEFKSLLSEKIINDGKITLANKIAISFACLYFFILITNITSNKPSTTTTKSDNIRCFYNSQRLLDATKEIECNYKCDGWTRDEKLYIARDSICPTFKY
jgi:hypothetical protein